MANVPEEKMCSTLRRGSRKLQSCRSSDSILVEYSGNKLKSHARIGGN
jgi:hypothetical protein